MSNTAVGAVYQQIIDDVINSSRTDFEDNGVDEGVLDELRKGWQKKLTQLQVAAFPWDPKPEPASAVINNTTSNAPPTNDNAAPSASVNPPYTQSILSPPSNSASVIPLPLPIGGNDARIKAEPGAQSEPAVKQEPDLHGVPMSSFAAGQASNNAAARASHLLQTNFGQRASASISALQTAVSHPAQGQPQQGMRPAGPAQTPLNAQQYRQQLASQQRIQQGAHANGPNGVAGSQVDGARDGFEGVLLRRGASGSPTELGRVQIDSMLHETMAARAKQMEGGGLMVPLRRATKRSAAASRDMGTGSHPDIPQVDGEGDVKLEDDVDEDAINSDLDDSDDGNHEDEEDDDMGPIMLCMYDKVQRVKNKWKCTLKDGVLTVNGKEYVFHKATGEYEW